MLKQADTTIKRQTALQSTILVATTVTTMDNMEERRKQSRLTIFINELMYIPSQYLPTPATHTMSNHCLNLQHIYARTNQYSYSFLPRTIRDRNNLNIANIDNIDLETFKCSI